MKWHRLPMPEILDRQGDIGFAAYAQGRTYSVVSVAGHDITATWSDATRKGPRLGSAELPIGASYPRMSPHVHSIGNTYPTIHAAQKACEAHLRQDTQ